MTPTYSQSNGRRWRYYVCLKAHRRGWSTCPSPSLPAHQIETFVIDRIRALGQDPDFALEPLQQESSAYLKAALTGFATGWAAMTTLEQARVARCFIERIDYDGRAKNIDLTLRPQAVRSLATRTGEPQS